MNAQARNVKMACIATLVFGVIALAVSILFITQFPTNVRSYVSTVDSVAMIYLGFQGARMINVPSNAAKIMQSSSVIVLLSFVCGAFLMISPDKIILQLIIGGLGLVLPLLVFVLARQMVTAQNKA